MEPEDFVEFCKSIQSDHELNSVDYTLPSAWYGHTPFLRYIIREVRPRTFVELGTHHGHSFFSACNAIKQFDIGCLAYAIDTWKGDEHSGFYGEDIFANFNMRVSRYPFANTIRDTFDSASNIFDNGFIDLLHIDGLHTYNAVKNDFYRWLPKLSKKGILLLHDIFVLGNDFGVNLFWKELKQSFSTIEFTHSYGLGVVVLNPEEHCFPLNSIREFDSESLTLLNASFQSIVAGSLGDLVSTQKESDQNASNLKQHLESLEKQYRSSSFLVKLLVKRLLQREI